MLSAIMKRLVVPLLFLYSVAIATLAESQKTSWFTQTSIRTSHRHILSDRSGNCQSEGGLDWFGNDINQRPYKHSSSSDCCSLCKQTSGCVGWVYRKRTSHCYLKKALSNEERCDDCVRGRVTEDPPVTSSIPDSCKFQSGTDWFGNDIYNTPFNIKDPGVCCEYCQKEKGCKAWLWRGKYNHCYLKHTLSSPAPCADCSGGILDKPVTSQPTAPVDFETRCGNDGERVAVKVAAGACAVLENRCPPAKSLIELKKSDNVVAPKSESETIRANEAILEEAFDQALTESCITIFEETCKRTAAEKAAMHNQECASILANGPEFSTRRCRDINDALRIFADAVEPLCEFDSSLADIND